MDRLKYYFQSFGIFNDEELKTALSYFETRELKKRDYFIREGESCHEAAFIESGIVRSYYTSQEGKENTYCFRFPNDLITSYASFITGSRSQETIQALSDVTLQFVKRSVIEELAADSFAWTKFLKLMAEQQYLELENRIFQLQRDTAGKRYEDLVKYHPEYIHHIPLQYLASYLGITQRHLSRIRRHSSF